MKIIIITHNRNIQGMPITVVKEETISNAKTLFTICHNCIEITIKI